MEDGMEYSKVSDEFIQAYYSSGAWRKNYWMGKSVGKNPCDMMVEQELIYNLRPDTIIECGSGAGGSALFYSQCSMLAGKQAKVLSIDIDANKGRENTNSIIWFEGSSTDPAIFNRVKANTSGVVLVVLDSTHTYEHVLKEIGMYSELVTLGSYIVVEDTVIGGCPIHRCNPCPMESVLEFLKTHDEFEIDYTMEKHLLTFNRRGYLKRVK